MCIDTCFISCQVALDRVFFLRRKFRPYEVNRTGQHHLQALADNKKGAILLGAHLGSFEAMRAQAKTEALPLNIVGHFDNAKMINALLEALDPEMAAKVIHVGEDPMAFAHQVMAAIEGGHMVAILGDRVGLNDKSVEVDFFGQKAAFPTGPFMLAAAPKMPRLSGFWALF